MVNKNEKLQLVLSLWGFKENLEIKEENIEYETKRESHIRTVSEDYILKMTNSEYEKTMYIFLDYF